MLNNQIFDYESQTIHEWASRYIALNFNFCGQSSQNLGSKTYMSFHLIGMKYQHMPKMTCLTMKVKLKSKQELTKKKYLALVKPSSIWNSNLEVQIMS